MSFSLVQVRGDGWRRQLELLAAANADGVAMTAQVAPRPVGLMLGLQCTLHPLLTNPVYREIAALPLAERVAVMADPSFKERVLAADASQRDDSKLGGRLIHAFHRMFELGDPPDYEPDAASSIAARAEREGRRRSTSRTTSLLRDGGRSFLYLPSLNYGDGNLDAVGEMLAHPNTVDRSRRRRRPRRHDLRRELPHDAADALGARPRTGPARPSVRGATPDERDRAHRRSPRPRACSRPATGPT